MENEELEKRVQALESGEKYFHVVGDFASEALTHDLTTSATSEQFATAKAVKAYIDRAILANHK